MTREQELQEAKVALKSVTDTFHTIKWTLLKAYLRRIHHTESNIIGYKLSGYVSKEVADIVFKRNNSLCDNDLYIRRDHIADYYISNKAKHLGILNTWFIPVYEDDSNTD